jgi:hypothetical protein
VLFARAQLADPGGDLQPPALSSQDWDQLVELSGAAQEVTKLPPDQRSLVTACLEPDGESRLATLSRNELAGALRRLAGLSRGLSAELQSEAKIIQRVVVRRWLRVGIGALLPIALSAYGVTQCGSSNERNLALHQPVTVSSKLPVDIGRDPSLLVDGDTHNLGFHTAEAPNQYVTIDLGQPQRIHRVVVYNRADCCKDRAVPLRVEVSQDGRSYEQVAERDEVFDVWKAKFSAVDARYVRLFRPKKACFHLAEVEVY